MRETVISEILEKKIIAIVRGVEPAEILRTAQALYDGGITLMEITFNQRDPDSFRQTAQSIAAVRAHMSGKLIAGAGTVTSTELVELACSAGAEYIISPDTDPAVIRRTRELGLVSLPGAYTPSEAKQAHNAGADFVKLFPCVGPTAPAYLKALCAPLSHIRFLAVGGVDASNAAAFLRAGAVGLGVGSSLVSRSRVEEGRFDEITAAAQQLVQAIHSV